MSRYVSCLASVALLIAAPCSLYGQVRWDDVNKVYWVSVRDEAGVLREMRVEPADRVTPVFELVQRDTAGRIEYRYRVGAGANSPQSLGLLRIPCATSAAIQERSGGYWNAIGTWGAETYCTFAIDRPAGDTLRLVRFTSALLAGPGTLIAVGGRELPEWPTSASAGETIALTPLVDSLSGSSPTGLVKRVNFPVPRFERAVVAETGSGLAILSQQLTVICGDTDWIQPGPTCAALAAQLEPALSVVPGAARAAIRSAALTAPERNTVRQALNTFLDSLTAGRDTTIHQNAFTVLSMLARTVRGGLAP